MMKAVFLSLTLLLGVFPYTLSHFNTLATSEHPPQCSHKSCMHHEQALTKGRQDKFFGAEMGKLIRSQITEEDYKIRTVVIDPGHGGHDGGCSGKDQREKVVALSIALKLGQAMQQQYPNLRVIYTRNRDVFIPLHKRATIANDNQADLFISIHCNAIPNAPQVRGSETYVMGLHRAAENLEVAKRENSSILLEDDYQQNYYGYDPNSPEGHIMLSMYQNAHLEQSILLANHIENQIGKFAKRRSRGVKQAGFLVLRKTTMPSVLVEAGYMTNKNDDEYLCTTYGQYKIAQSILRAFTAYKYEVEGHGSAVEAPAPTGNSLAVSQSLESLRSTKAPARPPKTIVKRTPQKQKVEVDQLHSKGIPSSYIISDRPASSTIRSAGISYMVQLAVSSKLLDTKETKWDQLDYSVQIKQEKGIFKYLAIGFQSFDSALKAKSELRQLGFSEAFVVAYRGAERISLDEARRTP